MNFSGKFAGLLILILLLCGVSTFSQTIDTTKQSSDTTVLNYQKQNEKLLENNLEEIDDSKLVDFLEYLETNPYDINTVMKEELEEIPFIGSVLARNIIDYRTKSGGFKSKKELLEIDGMSDEIYDNIKLYLYVKGSKSDYVKTESGKLIQESSYRNKNVFKNLDIQIQSRFLQDLQTRQGFIDGDYDGSKAKFYNRININYKNKEFTLIGNAMIEKDPGEKSLADFYSGYVELKNYKFIKSLVVGDYQLEFGQGLGMWSALGFSKGSISVDPAKKSGRPLRSYNSVNEVQFFRGAAMNVNFGRFDGLIFFSNNYYDASIDTTLDEISSLYFDGYHRTATERNKENSVAEKMLGGRLEYNYRGVKLGTSFWTSTFSKNIASDSGKQLYNFSGTAANMLSLDYDFVYKNMNIYGEFARSQSGYIAGLGAVRFTFYKIADLVFLYRNYPEGFAPVHSFAFGEKNGNTQNERGFYTGISFRPVKGLTINAYYDQFKFPYISFFEPVPLEGNDFLTYAEYKVNNNFNIYFKFRTRHKEETRTIEDEFGRDVKKVDMKNQMTYRLGFDYDISDKIRVRSRVDYTFIKYENFGGNNKGLSFWSDVRASVLRNLTLDLRLIFFNTDEYDSRIYEYENDIRGVFANYALYGQGRRWYIVAKLRPLDYVELQAKYAETYIDNAKSIGTGNDEIQGNINNKFNLGLIINF